MQQAVSVLYRYLQASTEFGTALPSTTETNPGLQDHFHKE